MTWRYWSIQLRPTPPQPFRVNLRAILSVADASTVSGEPQAPPAPASNPADYLTDKRSNILTNADQAAMLAKRLLTGRWAWCRALGWVAFDGRKWEARSTEAVRTEIMQFYRVYVDLEYDKL